MVEVNLNTFLRNKALVRFFVDFRFVDVIDNKAVEVNAKSGDEVVVSYTSAKILEEYGIAKIIKVV
ncbi:MAG: hypothetical protein QXL14_02140 [Candidatus Aenigmatarchaeota archaeon]